MDNKPGVYVKNGVRRVANTPARAVALSFEGYRLEETVPAESASYRDLQKQAKELGISANQSESALREAIALAQSTNVVVEDDENPTEETE